MGIPKAAVIYACMSPSSPDGENELQDLRRYVGGRGWPAIERVDQPKSGAKGRPAFEQLLADARGRRMDVVVCSRLARLGGGLTQLIALLDELAGLGVALVSLREGIDTTAPDGKLQMRIVAAIAASGRERQTGRGHARKKGRDKLAAPERILSEAVVVPLRGLPAKEPGRRLGVVSASDHRCKLSPPSRRLSIRATSRDREKPRDSMEPWMTGSVLQSGLAAELCQHLKEFLAEGKSRMIADTRGEAEASYRAR